MEGVNPLELAKALGALNKINRNISHLIGRSATVGNICEAIAAAILDIELEPAGNHPGSDGKFLNAPLESRSVNVKWRNDGDKSINMKESGKQPDYFLTLRGPNKSHAKNAKRNPYHPFAVKEVCLFETVPLVARLKKEGIPIKHQTRVGAEAWKKARIYPVQKDSPLRLTPQQAEQFDAFANLK